MTLREITKVKVMGGEYGKEDLLKLDEVSLRGLLHERAHHNIEVPLYPSLLKWKGEAIAGFGMQAQLVFDVWREKGFPETDDDIKWVKRYLDCAADVRAGRKPEISELRDAMPVPFSREEMNVVHRLIWERRSARGCWTDRHVSDELLAQICDAGRAAPIGCNLDEVRFIILRSPEEKKMMRCDISVENAVLIVLCYDKRPSHVVGQDRPEAVPQNRELDCAAAGDHMLLMTHALGLSGVWLTKTNASAQAFKEQWGLPSEYEVAMHIAVGWPAMGSIKSSRVPLEYMMLRKGQPRNEEECL